MKNGKIVPFKESVKHRKCLQKQDDIPQAVIKFNKPISKIKNENRKWGITMQKLGVKGRASAVVELLRLGEISL